MQIIENKALLLKVREPNRILTTVPNSKLVGTNEVLVRWGVEEAQILTNMRIKDIPSPIIGKYNWPGMFTPFEHQKTTASFLTLHRRAFCFNEQGTGKTPSVIWAADYLMTLGLIKRVLVLCPLSIMTSAWENDLFRCAMHRTCAIAHSYSKEKRRKAISGEAEFVICNFDGLEIVKEDVKNGGFDLIVVDECFVAGTLVATPQGQRPIEQLEAGDEVLTASGVKHISRLVRNTTKHLVRVTTNAGSITCTPDHPFFTDIGWVTAKNLEGRRLVSTSDLRNLRANVSDTNLEMGVGTEEGFEFGADLLQILRSEEVPPTEPRQVLLQHNAERAARVSIGGKAVGGIQSPHVEVAQSKRTQTDIAWGEWYGDDGMRTSSVLSPSEYVCMELPRSVGGEATRLSYLLQIRFCKPLIEDRAGGRWKFARYEFPKNAGQKESSQTSGVRVESVSYIECDSEIPVFNLEVEGTPNYFVGGCLVHNCNAYKNVSTKRWKTFHSIVRPDTWIWMLTGTPAAQLPTDAYGLAKLINPSGVPKFFGAFRDQVMRKITTFKWIPKQEAQTIVHAALQPAIRYTKEECLDLPDMTYTTRHVPLSAQQEKYYETLRKHMIAYAAGEEITTVNAAANLNKLLQLSCGAVYSDTGEVIAFDAKNRMTALLEVIEEASHKVIVFAPFRHAIDIVSEELKANHVACEVIHGGVTATKRTEIFAKFQNDKNPQVLVIQPQAAAHGVTLHAANVVVWWGPITSIETYLQANARVHRAGQRNPCTVVHLEGSPVERRIYKMLSEKVDVHTKLVDLYKNVIEDG